MWLFVMLLGIYFMVTGYQEMRQQIEAKKGKKKRKSHGPFKPDNAGLSDLSDDDLLSLLKSGDKAGAVEAYQMASGANLAEAQDYVEMLEGRRR
jgi:hypothetical protein